MGDSSEGARIFTLRELGSWINAQPQGDQGEPFTFTIDLDRTLRLAPRRSEHVACAAGGAVLSAGEISFARPLGEWEVSSVNNHSTGYCPGIDSWVAVEYSLRRLGIKHPSGFTETFTFRLCPTCAERNLVKDSYFFCVFCEAELPLNWNIGDQ
ncbi:hypothetical protein ACIBAG_42610 [Streptomyces sp. NPDC051243]|uniref:hypothetical protein n=1 Tax=Streptomyces sp. NPDC051243 TaxID=3365646 RepID=UPI00379C59E7